MFVLMSIERKLAVIGGFLGAVASVATILSWVFDYGNRSKHDVFGWVNEWAHASGSRPGTLWSGLGIVSFFLLLSLLLSRQEPAFMPHLCACLAACTWTLPAYSHLLSWSAYLELWVSLVVAVLVGWLIGSQLDGPASQAVIPRMPRS